MDEESYHLNRFYRILYENIKKYKKLKDNSIILSFLKTRKASIFRILKRSTMSSNLIPLETLTSLLKKGLIQNYGQFNTYIISAKGVWIIEKENDNMSLDLLFSFFNKEYFNLKIEADLNDKEKVILFTMIATRTFSDKSTIDLKKDLIIRDKWKEIMEKTHNFLKTQSYINIKKEKLFNTTGNIHIVSSLFRHNNKMVQKTRGIYNYNRKQEYYLDIYKNNIFNDEKLTYLFWKLFDGKISNKEINIITNYCNEISLKDSIYLFNIKNHIFSMPKYDIKIKDAIINSLLAKNKWFSKTF